jgi:N-acetylmuramoyl-L-alanine amidase
MAQRARFVLVVATITATACAALLGWSLFRETPPAADAETPVVFDVASPTAPRQVHYLTEAEARATLGEEVTPPAPQPPPPSLQPVPKYAVSAGIDARARNADGARLSTDAPPAPPRQYKGVVVLDPGHGRGDPGAVHYLPDGSGRWDVTEADSNLQNAELIRDDLTAMGYQVYLTRNGAGQGPAGPLPLQFITSDLYARVALARAADADLYLAIHGNGASVPSISGPETWYCGKRSEGAANEQLARAIQRAMMDALHEYGYFPPDRGIKEDAQAHHSGDFCQFVVTREAPVPAALLEFLFLSNDADATVLVDPAAHEVMARYVARAIDAFLQARTRP